MQPSKWNEEIYYFWKACCENRTLIDAHMRGGRIIGHYNMPFNHTTKIVKGFQGSL
jgi:hypothetical protein